MQENLDSTKGEDQLWQPPFKPTTVYRSVIGFSMVLFSKPFSIPHAPHWRANGRILGLETMVIIHYYTVYLYTRTSCVVHINSNDLRPGICDLFKIFTVFSECIILYYVAVRSYMRAGVKEWILCAPPVNDDSRYYDNVADIAGRLAVAAGFRDGVNMYRCMYIYIYDID